MSFAIWRTLSRSSILLATLLAASPATAEWKPKPPTSVTPSKEAIQEARSRYEKGVSLYEVEGDVEGALVELQRAYEVAPSYKVLYNIGQVARTARDYATSLRAFEGYLEYGGDDVGAKRKKSVEDEVKALEGLVASLDVVTNIRGATITIDDAEVGQSPLTEPVLVNAGKRRVEATYDGRTKSSLVTVAGRDRKVIELVFPEEAGVTGPVGPVPGGGEPAGVVGTGPGSGPSTEPTREAGTSYLFLGWIATGVLAASAAVTGIIALSEDSDLDDMTYVGSTPPTTIEDQEATVQTLAIVTDVLAISAAAALGVTLYFTLTDEDDTVDVTVGAGPRGGFVRGTFQ